jgi:hypothetical protein
MNVIEFALVPDVGWPNDFAAAVYIDGEPLTERVRRVEAPHRQAAGYDPSAVRYQWVRAEIMLLPSRHLLGTSGSPWSDWLLGLSEVLVCTCGEAVCGSVGVSVRLWPRHVGWLAWRRFPLTEAHPRCEFQPQLFSRAQYEAELVRVSEKYHRAIRST